MIDSTDSNVGVESTNQRGFPRELLGFGGIVFSDVLWETQQDTHTHRATMWMAEKEVFFVFCSRCATTSLEKERKAKCHSRFHEPRKYLSLC